MEMNSTENKTAYIRKSVNRKRRKKIVSVLACIVVFCTTYALILPAITMTKTHQVLACPLDIHTHSASCYDEGHNLICGQADFVVHTHREECYDADGNLTCELPEIKAHKHTATCYEEVKTPTCPLEENEEHTHADECYAAEKVLVCDNPALLHRHVDSCYDENGRLICGQLEVREHIHQEGCFTTVRDVQKTEKIDVSAELPETAAGGSAKTFAAGSMRLGETPNGGGDTNENPGDDANDSEIDMGNMIINVTVEHREAGTDVWLPLHGADVKVGEELLFTLSYEVSAHVLSADHRMLGYQVPEVISMTDANSGLVYNNDKRAVGTYEISASGHIIITFNEQYAVDNENGSVIDGHISFSAAVNAIRAGDDGNVSIPFSDNFSLPIRVHDTEGDLNVTKKSHDVDFFNGTLTYEIVVTSIHGTTDVVTLEDSMRNMVQDGDITVTDKNGNDVTDELTQLESGNLGLFQLPQMDCGDEYHITYRAKCAKSFTDSTITGTNEVKVTSKDSEGSPVEASDKTEDSFTRKIIQKSGAMSDDGKVKWDIIINAASPHVNIAGWTLRDTMDTSGVTVEISPNPTTGTGKTTIELPYTFPADRACDTKYTVTYTAPGDSTSTNTATLTAPNGTDTATTGETGVAAGKADLKKEGTGVYTAGVDANGNKLVNCEWEITLDATTVAVECKTDTILGVTGDFWTLRDNPVLRSTNTPHYFTTEQLMQNAESIEKGIIASGYQGGYYIFASDDSKLNSADTVLLKRGGSADSKWDAYRKAPNAGTEYDNIVVVFDTDMQESTLRFKSYSTMNIGDGTTERKGRNYIYLKDKNNTEIGTYKDETYTPVVIKMDHIKDKYGKYIVGSSNHTENELVLGDAEKALVSEDYKNYSALGWVIDLNLPKDEPYYSDVIITESLPEGVCVLPGNRHTGDERIVFYVTTNSKLNTSTKWDFNFIDGTEDNTRSTTVRTSLGICTLTKREDSTDYSVWAKKLDDRTYEIHIPKELANYLITKGYNPRIEVYAYIKDGFVWDGLTHDFTNNVTVKYEKNEIGSSSQTQHITRSVITKAHNPYNEDLNQIPYTIAINPDGEDLVPGSETLTLTDVLSYTMPDTHVDASLDYKSIHVYCTDTDPETDITEQCAYTAKGNEEGSAVTRTFQMTLPDSMPLRVVYTYQMSGNGKVTDLVNKATLTGNGTSSEVTDDKVEVVVRKSTAYATEVGITVYKVDSQNYGVHLNGAKFTLEKWDGTKWVFQNNFETQTITTSTDETDGIFKTGKLDYNVAYRLTETEAPAGYEMKNGTQYEFYIESSDTTSYPFSMPAGFSGKVLNDGDSITVENTASPFELPETGGEGAAMYYAAGGMLMVAVAALLVCRKRRNTVY